MDCVDCERLKRQLIDASVDLANAQSVLNGNRSSQGPLSERFAAAIETREAAHDAYVDHLATHVEESPSDLH
jgi:hypothetical protein